VSKSHYVPLSNETEKAGAGLAYKFSFTTKILPEHPLLTLLLFLIRLYR
jgi:hypothetical protein